MRRAFAFVLLASLTACAGGKKPAAGPVAAPTPVPTAAPSPTPAPTVSPTPPAPRESATVTGTVTYRQRIALTPEAVVQVELRDVSRQDADAPLLARQLIEKPGQVPVSFALTYDPEAIDPRHAYAVSARITDRGQLQFVTEARVPVLTNGAPSSAEIVVVPVK